MRDGYSRAMLVERIGDKFGATVLEDVLSVTERKRDDDDVELDWEERKTDYLERIGAASERARWVWAAEKIHNGRSLLTDPPPLSFGASSLLTDLGRTAFPESVWGRFKRGPEETVRWYRRVYDRLTEVGFRAPIMDELRDVVVALEGYVRST